ncbi:cell death abnormality protein 1-like [Bolinopsis microptera]|uniref:cell death abnormality protein 1-like n=1 Tax=Bolinopsis microptera TaxID=2820187 RepID=UPI0030799FF8
MKLIFLVCILLLLLENIDCSGKGEIKLYKYKDSTNCGDVCDFYFKNFVIQEEEGNEFLNVIETDDTGNTDTVYFSNLEQLKDAIPVKINAGRSIKISFEVWDEDTGNDDYERTMSGLVVPFSGIRSGGPWWWKSFVSDNNAEGDEKQATLKIKYKLLSCDSHFTGLGCNSCVANYYGTECGKYCKPVSGHYTCHPTTGSKVCAGNRAGIECDDCVDHFEGNNCERCVQNYYPAESCNILCIPNPERYICTYEGDKQCLQYRTGSDCEDCVANHYGEDCSKTCHETSSYTCDESGEKDCKEHFYPPQICDTRCVPVTGNYTCNNTTGEKICLEGKEGEGCDECQNRNKVGFNCEKCIDNYFGETCSKFCQETTNNRTSYTCDGSGDKDCKEHYYPQQICNTHCKPVTGNYTCNQTTGERICVEGKKGQDCDECQNINKEGRNCDKCIENHFGEDCSVHCNESQGNYTCDQNTGEKKCEADYYPAQECNIYCQEVQGNYTCDPDNGEKVCKLGKNG